MKIIIDTDKHICKVGTKLYENITDSKKEVVNLSLRQFLNENTNLSDYEEDCMWMSYRYCVGRHTIASSMHANAIWKNCKGRMSKDRELFTAFDINREVEQSMTFIKPYFHFPITSLNRIYTPALDIFFEFLEDYNINSIEDLIKYRDIKVILSDNERGYKIETTTWEEWLRPQVKKIVDKYYEFDDNEYEDDFEWKYFLKWKESPTEMTQVEMIKQFENITRDIPKVDSYYLHNIEDLMVWNDLVHCFDYEHHHKSILIDGSECEWFWSWTNKSEQHDDGYYYRTFGYKKIRVPVDRWNGLTTTWIPDESIKEDIY